jgi:hypothetical protein
MSRKRRPPISRNRKATRCQVGRIEKSSVRERTVPRDRAEFTEFFRSRDPQIMGPLMLALNKSRTLFSWLTPGSRVFGVPQWGGEDLPWLTIIDDLDPAALGPPSFDAHSLEWWATRAEMLVVDAATPTVHLYKALGSSVAMGRLVLIVQTVETRRLLWHRYFVSVRPPTARTAMMHHLKNTRPGGPKQVLRAGGLHDDFVSDRPIT